MPSLALTPLSPDDLEDITAFEWSNRAFFEAHINARPAGYYDDGGIQEAIACAMQDAAEDKAYQFLARNELGTLVARVNLMRIRRSHYHCADLGYRVAEAHNGKGYASEAVRLALSMARDQFGLHRIEATAKPQNQGSIKVLLRNGFTQFGRSTRSFQLAGVWHDLLHFERHIAE